MPDFLVRILRQVEVFQKVEERTITAPSEASARREASYILAEKFADQPDIIIDIDEKKVDITKNADKYPF